MRQSGRKKLDTTLGELISAVSDAALEVCKDKDTAYLLASIALEDIFENDVRHAEPAATSVRELRRRMRYH
jgi:hypothetical protein